ncbi:MAG: MBL fold metallo-hydrolase [Promethearchaeota archaeon]|jgi:glyoxylase-like metal-dependent hydrolase (beta-lactamase superfamily II)
MDYIQVSENVFLMPSFSTTSPLKNAIQTVTSTCIALPNELIFVDCSPYPDLTLQFRKDMEKKFNKKTTHLLLTHTHWDHILSMEVFKNVDIVSSATGIDQLNNFLTALKSTEEDKWSSLFLIEEQEIIDILKTVELFSPNILVKKELKIGEEPFNLIFHVLGGHSIDSASIYFPYEKVLCAGDNLIESFAQLPGTPSETLAIYKYWESLDIDKIVPGHGNIVGKDYLVKIKLYFEKLHSTLHSLIDQKIPRKLVYNHPSLPKYFAESQPNWIESPNSDMKWLEMTIRSWYRYLKRK